jgi:hypothetical protein
MVASKDLLSDGKKLENQNKVSRKKVFAAHKVLARPLDMIRANSKSPIGRVPF